MDQTDYYNRHAGVYYENTVDLDMTEILEQFIELLPESSTVLDLGCGSGRDSLYFIEKGYDVTSIDGAKELCELAQIHIGQDVLCMTYEDMDFKEVFDGVWACASLVHITRTDMDSILDKITDSLKPHGVLYMSFKYGEYSGVKDGIYYTEYKTRMMRELIASHENLEIIEIFKTNDIRPERKEQEWLNVFLRKVPYDLGE
ncbi:methyltransferase family protein [Mobilisporobacter senegalensis]|uniref:Methyltransferase family protein n=1 Tax=Mobilisporobacter senegalensis TaxID=1329262 RepID=A0A3N1XB17_9FIRM|nr:class I SAM-dependent methyltransferase [Mobilisporobacter senegalensis]ROR21917.1 methyltransferase family protein [Mobilisporobacter senegalensis]